MITTAPIVHRLDEFAGIPWEEFTYETFRETWWFGLAGMLKPWNDVPFGDDTPVIWKFHMDTEGNYFVIEHAWELPPAFAVIFWAAVSAGKKGATADARKLPGCNR